MQNNNTYSKIYYGNAVCRISEIRRSLILAYHSVRNLFQHYASSMESMTTRERMVQGKRVRIAKDVDMLLNLPDAILNKILSSLPTKDAFRTSILSKKWENKWLSIIDIIDMDDDRDLFLRDQFANMVAKVVTHFDNSFTLQKLRLRCRNSYRTTRVITWISAAVRRNVQSLDLHMHSNIPFSLPESFYRHSSLKELRMTMPITILQQVTSFAFFTHLKVLELCRAIFSNQHNEDPADETLSFPVLEHMSLNDCKWINFRCVRIDAPLLVHFRLGNCTFKELAPTEQHERKIYGCIFRVMSPNLRRFMYYGGEYLERFFLHQPSLVTDATYSFALYGRSYLMEFSYANAISTIAQFQQAQVKHLELTMEVIVYLVKKPKKLDNIPTLEMVNTLKVSSNENFPMDCPSLLLFLQKTPNVHTLILEMVNTLKVSSVYMPPVPQCVQYKVRKLKFVYSDHYGWSPEDLNLMKYLVIIAATTLKEIEIYAPGNTNVPKTTLTPMLRTVISSFASPNGISVNII